MNAKALATCLMLLCASAQTISQTQLQFTREETRPLSAYVFATFLSREPGEVELLVLWRGSTPRWFTGPGGARGSGTAEAYRVTVEFATVQLDLSYDRTRRVARIRDIEVSLSEGRNVLMVDDVDQKKGPPAAKAIAADLKFTPGPSRGRIPAGPGNADIVSMLTRSAEIISFLRCDPATRDPTFPPTGYVCDQLNPK